MYELLM